MDETKEKNSVLPAYDGNMINDEPIFDNELLGKLIRTARQRSDFRSGPEFCGALYRWGGIGLGVQTLYRIENGLQTPSLEVLIAIAVVLSRKGGDSPTDALKELGLDRCFCSYYKSMMNSKQDGADPLYIAEPETTKVNVSASNIVSITEGMDAIDQLKDFLDNRD